MTSASAQANGSAVEDASTELAECAGDGPALSVPAGGLAIERVDPPYQFIAARLRQQIASGVLRPGDRLPSSRELERHFGYAYMTIRRGVDVLRTEGLVNTVHGVVSFVGPRTSDSGPAKVTPRRPSGGPARLAGGSRQGEAGLSRQFAELAERVQALEEAVWGAGPEQ
ncbi:winged helix-turn-helix domain-containing protein [Streptomyces sp. NPDC007088]|uniref:winged helix-turn-helix domain-containing protein n=1 Tax=Streptomyces sp. NPDC007088 TaxID=3364773 RepID=UPI0036D04B5F